MQGLANTSKNGLKFKPEIAKSSLLGGFGLGETSDCGDRDLVGSPN